MKVRGGNQGSGQQEEQQMLDPAAAGDGTSSDSSSQTQNSDQQGDGQQAAGDSNTDAQQQRNSDMVPRSRLNDVSRRVRELEAAATAREAADREAQERNAREQGRWQELAETRERDLGTLRPQVERLTERERRMGELLLAQQTTRLAALPERARQLYAERFPEGSPRDVLDVQTWLDETESLVRELQASLATQQQNGDASRNVQVPDATKPGAQPNPKPEGQGNTKMTPEQQAALVRSNYGSVV